MSVQLDARLERARRSLDGLSIGDAFGERFFISDERLDRWTSTRTIDAPGPWPWTDDTALALAVLDALEARGEKDPESLAKSLAERIHARYHHDRNRGYGYGMHRLFELVAAGASLASAAAGLFEGTGSFGNGAAMRVGPLGAYYADAPLASVVAAARASAKVTHTHIEGQAGAIAIAVAGAVGWQTRTLDEEAAREQLYAAVLEHTPTSETRDRIVKASHTNPGASTASAAARLGNGQAISAQDTVPFCLWALTANLRDYEAALWATVTALGDRDTTCAIVGGVVALTAPEQTIPPAWRGAREPLP